MKRRNRSVAAENKAYAIAASKVNGPKKSADRASARQLGRRSTVNARYNEDASDEDTASVEETEEEKSEDSSDSEKAEGDDSDVDDGDAGKITVQAAGEEDDAPESDDSHYAEYEYSDDENPSDFRFQLGVTPVHTIVGFRPSGCNVCGTSHSQKPNRIILCDGCDKEYHLQCLKEPLAKVPKGKSIL